MKISTIMASKLSDYPGAAINREEKFIRAVKSWHGQFHNDRELVIVSDSCEITDRLYQEHFSHFGNMKLVQAPKKTVSDVDLFSGSVRQEGLQAACGTIVTYLDGDDFIDSSHLSVIENAFVNTNPDWVYFNDYIWHGKNEKRVMKEVSLRKDSIGASSVAHLRMFPVSWVGCDGYGHDWTFVQRLMQASESCQKIYGCGYNICHVPGQIDN